MKIALKKSEQRQGQKVSSDQLFVLVAQLCLKLVLSLDFSVTQANKFPYFPSANSMWVFISGNRES